ncbi:fibronectin type III domain-containing protein [Spongiimicrobium salis]|uniref:fibronectin type III domain-containing protein n=1 Tax=Spongiimicrobium salis TaxID=1667022 RepID=UPI00374CCE58
MKKFFLLFLLIFAVSCTEENLEEELSLSNEEEPSNLTTKTALTDAIEGDVQRPTSPSNVKASNTGRTLTDLSWEPGTDNVKIEGYNIYQDGVYVGNSKTTNYRVTKLEVNKSYDFTVTTVDEEANESVPTKLLSVATVESTDTEAPTGIPRIQALNITGTSATITWTAATDNVGVTGYIVYGGGVVVATPTGTTYEATGLTGSTSYSFIVAAVDAAGNESPARRVIFTTAEVSDSEAPERPGRLRAANITETTVDLSWLEPADNVGVTSYSIYSEGVLIASPTTTNHTVTGLTPGTDYRFIISASDAAGNESPRRLIDITTLGSATNDTEAPERPGRLRASNITETTVDLSWLEPADNIGVTSYNIYSEGAVIGVSNTTNFQVRGLSPGTAYRFIISALDAAGNESPRRLIDVTTEAAALPLLDGVRVSTFGFDRNDSTWALRNAMNSEHEVLIVDRQSTDWLVGPLTFRNIRNKTIVFEPGVVLRARPGAFPNTGHRLFQMIECENIEIIGNGATFRMNKSEYTSGEQRHALSIINSRNITVRDLTFRDSGGDGIYISRLNDGDFNENITLENVQCINNRRQGLTVISVDGLTVRNSVFRDNIGTLPAAGVDLEPEGPLDRLQNILIENSSFTGNFGEGVLFSLSKTNSSSPPLDVTFRNITVSDNFSRSNSRRFPVEVKLGMSSEFLRPIRGTVVFDGLLVENSDWGAVWSKKTQNAYHVTIRNATFRNISRGSNDPVIHLGLLGYNTPNLPNLGGYDFDNVTIDYDGVDPSIEIFGPRRDWDLIDVTGDINVISPTGTNVADFLNKLPTVPLTIR